ncbi:MAG TPA: hypothetical protein VMG59_02975 [Phycisphaerae bacterium]|nr:hypothetical protein [Phycisphaerae bacterium]
MSRSKNFLPFWLCVAAGCLISATAGLGDTSATPDTQPSLEKATADMQQALRDLSSDRYETRKNAQLELQQALGEQFAAIISATNAQGPELETRLDSLLTMNADLSRWAMAVLKLPPQERQAVFNWGLTPQVLPLVSGAFSPDPMTRASVARPIGRLSGPNGDWLLETLLNDPQRVVYLSAMDAAWDHKPTEEMVRTMWQKAVGSGEFSPPQLAPIYVNFRDQKIQIQQFIYYWDTVSDGGYAAQVLEHWDPPLLSPLLVNFTRHLSDNPSVASNFFAGPGMILARNYADLLSLAKPLDAAPPLLSLVGTPVNNSVNLQFNGKSVHWDDHTIILYLLIVLANQDPAKFHFYRSPLYGGTWLVETQAQEEADIKAICAWWMQHGVTTAKPPVAAPGNQNTQGFSALPVGGNN